MVRTDMYEGLLAETVMITGANGDTINAYLARPLGPGPHPAMVLAHHVPAAMLFVPSRGGLSHTPDEFSSPEHCDLGARVLARTVRRLVTPSSRRTDQS